ncbi:hypothetical protein [Moraxella lacunata]
MLKQPITSKPASRNPSSKASRWLRWSLTTMTLISLTCSSDGMV